MINLLFKLFMLLKKNTLKWQDQHSIAEIQIENFGVSDQQGEAELVITNEFDSNHGINTHFFDCSHYDKDLPELN